MYFSSVGRRRGSFLATGESSGRRGAAVDPVEARMRDRTRAELQTSLGEGGYAGACTEGWARTLEDALALAIRAD
jgi:hypothetical protein